MDYTRVVINKIHLLGFDAVQISYDTQFLVLIISSTFQKFSLPEKGITHLNVLLYNPRGYCESTLAVGQ